MTRFVSVLALAAGLVIAACSEQPAPAIGPRSQGGTEVSQPGIRAVKTPPVICSFSSMNPLVSKYFGGTSDKQTVTSLLNAMQSAYSVNDTTTTRDRGFDAMSHIASQVKAGNTDFQDASSLTNAILACMLFTTAELPATFPEDFTVATNPAQDGGYDVRGEAPVDPDADPAQRVYSRPSSFDTLGNPTHYGFSGLAPLQDSHGTPFSWSQIIQTTRAPTRVFLYGRPGSNSQSYDWRAVPRTVSYVSPLGGYGGLVGLCVVNTSSLVHETGNSFTGFNPYVDAYFMDPALCQTFALRRSWSPLRLFDRVFGVPPVWGNPGGMGGAVGGHSQFDGEQIAMTATFTQQPPANVTVCTPVSGQPNAGCPATALFQVALSTSGTGTKADGTQDTGPVGPATVFLTANTNNGTPGAFCQLVPPANTTFICEPVNDTTAITLTASSGGAPGFAPAVFANLFFTKTGAERLIASSALNGRSVTAGTSANKMNVKP